MADDQTRSEMNRLYWGSDASVGEIADRLGVSRRALYDGIDPRPAGAPCPDCGAPLGYRNRTAADRREATCGACGREMTLDGASTPGRPAEQGAAANGGARAGPEEVGEEPEVEQLKRGARLSPMPPRAVPGTATGPALGGALLAGLAAGAALGYMLRRG